jgi:N-acetyl-anhydromuramyl-L-alanine amidase AmpD
LMVHGGLVRDGRIQLAIYPGLEHGPMESVSGIVLHQTSSDYVIKTMAAYAFRRSGVGAHFLINPAGQIFQTARINQICWHVGRIKSYCKQVYSCTPTDDQVFDEIAREVGDNRAEYQRRVDAWEQRKPSASRFPTNNDSIGIEVVGAPKGGVYGAPTFAQQESSRWLVRALIATLNVDRKRVFPHGRIAPHKKESEGGKISY